MPLYIVKRLTSLLKKRGKNIKSSKILILGVAYKPDINDPRESPGIDLLTILMRRGARIYFHDPYFKEIKINNQRIKCANLIPQFLKQIDCVVIITPHSSYRLKWIVDNARLVFDTRNAIASGLRDPKVIRL